MSSWLFRKRRTESVLFVLASLLQFLARIALDPGAPFPASVGEWWQFSPARSSLRPWWWAYSACVRCRRSPRSIDWRLLRQMLVFCLAYLPRVAFASSSRTVATASSCSTGPARTTVGIYALGYKLAGIVSTLTVAPSGDGVEFAGCMRRPGGRMLPSSSGPDRGAHPGHLPVCRPGRLYLSGRGDPHPGRPEIRGGLAGDRLRPVGLCVSGHWPASWTPGSTSAARTCRKTFITITATLAVAGLYLLLIPEFTMAGRGVGDRDWFCFPGVAHPCG